MYWWLVPIKISSRKSSFLVVDAFWPTPPLFWILYSSNEVLLIYPACEIVMTTFSSGIISSIERSPPAYSITDLLSSPYLSLISFNSSEIIFILLFSFSRISFKSSMSFLISSYSDLSLSCSNPVNCLNLISTIAFAWTSESLNFLIKLFLASSAFFEAFIKAITSSILSEAIIKPSSIWHLSSAFFNSNLVLLTTTSCLWSTKCLIISFRFSIWGRPFTRAIVFTLKEDWSGLYLYNLFRTILGIASLFKTKTILIPLRSDSSLIVEIPSNFLSLTKSAIFLIISALLTWYGISVTIIDSLPLTSSISAFPRITTLPLPVWNASLTPS